MSAARTMAMTDEQWEQFHGAAAIMSEAWAPYGELMRASGLEHGYWRGHAAGERETHELYQRWLGVSREFLKHPRFSEVQARRQDVTSPCGRKDCNCSRCTRYAATLRNIARYGSVDYPGAQMTARAAA